MIPSLFLLVEFCKREYFLIFPHVFNTFSDAILIVFILRWGRQISHKRDAVFSGTIFTTFHLTFTVTETLSIELCSIFVFQYNIKKKEEIQEIQQEEPNPLMRKKKTPEELAAEAEAEDEDEFTSKYCFCET